MPFKIPWLSSGNDQREAVQQATASIKNRLAVLNELDEEEVFEQLEKDEQLRNAYLRQSPSNRLRYFRQHPAVFREYLKQRAKRDEKYRSWTRRAGYKLDSGTFDPILLGMQWSSSKKGGSTKGTEGKVGEPFFVSRDLMKEGHMHIRGRTRSGKSALAITPLLQQLIRPYTVTDRQGEEIPGFRDAIFVIDLGGDLALFNFAQQQAEKHGRTFRFLSLESKDNWNYFDPFEAAGHGDDRIIRIAILLQKAFSLDHGLAYAASYFSSRNLYSLLEVARKLANQNQDAHSSVTLSDVSRHLEEANVKDAEEIRMIFQFLTEYEQLEPFGPYEKPNPRGEDIINLDRSLENSEVVYFFLPTLSESMTSRQIAGLALYTLISAAQQRVRKQNYQSGDPLPHAWVFVDEFQQLAGSSYADVLAQASKFGLSLIMANQTTTQLDVRDLNLADIVRDNTFCKLYFTITGEQDIQALKAFSKEARGTLSNKAESMKDLRAATQEYLTTELHTDEILDASSTNQHCFVLLDDGTGHREPVRIWTDYAMSLEEFRTLKSKPPLQYDTETKGVRRKPVVPEKGEPLWKIARKKNPSPAWQPTLSTLLYQKRREEKLEQAS